MEVTMHSRFYDRNFGVLEIIVSVAILAAFSVFVLRLFVAASADEKKTLELDTADYTAVSYIERFENSTSPFELFSSPGKAVPASDSYRENVIISNDMSAFIVISKDSENSGGSTYKITVDIKKSTDGSDIYKLSDYKYFS